MITALTLAPILAAVVILVMPEGRARAVALGGALLALALTVCLLALVGIPPFGGFFSKFWLFAFGAAADKRRSPIHGFPVERVLTAIGE